MESLLNDARNMLLDCRGAQMWVRELSLVEEL